MVDDRIYPSGNKYGIPDLRHDRQPQSGLLLPFDGWGHANRRKIGVETWHFYTDDYRFENVWKRPEVILHTLCKCVIEPNFSIFDITPLAQALYQIYRKRWLARYFQEKGIDVYADLNVPRGFQEYNLLGIPNGYNAFATRGCANNIKDLEDEIRIARTISGFDIPNMIVYGGGEKTRDVCLQAGILYVNDHLTERRIGELDK